MSKRTKWLLAIGVIAVLVIGFQVVAFANLTGSNFQGGDGDLSPTTPTGATGIDWNSFDPITWSNTAPNAAPYRLADEVKASGPGVGWRIVGKEDDAATTSDTGFAGGTKQDDDCASVIGTKSPNKDDLKRAYLSTKVIGSGASAKTFLNLAWVRIPQNTTSSSAHVGFEFNQNDGLTPTGLPSTEERCPNVKGQPSPLVKRKSGDMLIVYDFEGSATDAPVLTLRRWYVAGGATANPGLPTFTGCEVQSNSPPCWGQASGLAAFSEAKVNTSDVPGPITDALSPPGPPGTGGGPSDDESLGTNEFGEASINLTDALPSVFGPGACNSFGKAEVVSRSSGNSAQAQMMDLVGPVDFSLSSCGTIIIKKHTSPRDLDQDFSFTSGANAGGGTGAIAGAQVSCTQTTTGPPAESPTSFILNDGSGDNPATPNVNEAAGDTANNTQTCSNVPAGSYTVTEGDDPTGFTFNDVSCTPSTGASSGTQDATNPKQANITLAAGGTVTCTFVNDQDKQTTINTAQGFIPQDTATISGTGLVFDGTVDFKLLKGTLGDAQGETCANTTDTVVYSQDNVALTGTTTKSASTSNLGGPPSTDPTDGYTILAADAGSFYWKVFYDGVTDPDVTSCNETSTVSPINNGTAVSNPPTL